jgi:hypothetical protein
MRTWTIWLNRLTPQKTSPHCLAFLQAEVDLLSTLAGCLLTPESGSRVPILAFTGAQHVLEDIQPLAGRIATSKVKVTSRVASNSPEMQSETCFMSGSDASTPCITSDSVCDETFCNTCPSFAYSCLLLPVAAGHERHSCSMLCYRCRCMNLRRVMLCTATSASS